MTDLIAQEEHSDIMGGSSATKRVHCPGSYRLEETQPKPPESEAAARGTALHMAMEDYLNHHDGEPPEVLIGKVFYGWTITTELVNVKIKPALEAFDRLIKMVGGDLDFMIEAKVSLNEVIKGAFGTIDILGKGADRTLVVGDWKFGDGVPVSPESNDQCGFYGSAALYDPSDEIADIVFGDDDPNAPMKVVFAIIQPREGYPDEDPLKVWWTDTDWLEQWLTVAEKSAAKILEPDAPVQEGSWCRWCRANKPGVCPLKGQVVAQVADMPKPAGMDATTIAYWLDQAERAETTIKELKNYAKAEAEKGAAYPGWKLVPSQARRRYVNEDLAEAELRKMKIKVSDFTDQKLKSPAQLEKTIGKKKFAAFAKEHVSMVSSGVTLVRDTDPRLDVGAADKQLENALATVAGKSEAE